MSTAPASLALHPPSLANSGREPTGLNLPIIAALAAALVLLLGATAWMYAELSESSRRIGEQAFELEAGPLANGLERYVDEAVRTLSGARGLFAASPHVTRGQWKAYVAADQSENPLPGIKGVGFSQLIRAEDLAAHEASVRAEGFPEYQVRPRGPREVYSSIVYIEPFTGQNLRAFGYDMYSDPVRREAMDAAIRTGKPTMSASVQLVQNEAGDVAPGFLVYVPVYRDGARSATEGPRDVVGFVYSPIRLNELVGEAVSYTHQDEPRIAFSLSDAADPDRVLYRFPSSLSVKNSPGYESRVSLSIAQREWILHFTSLPNFEKAYRSRGALVALCVGTLLSVSIVAFAYLLFRYRTKSNSLAIRTSELGFQLALNRSVTEQMSDPVIVTDTDDHVTFMNAAAIRQLGFTLDEMQQGTLHAMIHHHHADGSAFPADACPLVQAYHGGSVDNFETVLFRKDGSSLNVIASAAPLYSGQQRIGGVLVVHDITARKRTEEALLASNQELQRFAYVASHDLKTPLRSIVSFAQLLHESAQLKLSEEENQWVNRIVTNARKMDRLVTSLLEYARLDAKARSPENVDLNRVAEAAIDMLHAAIEEAHAHVSCTKLPTVLGDATQLAQVFQNLIGNAVKYRSDAPLQIQIRSEVRGDHALISIRDNGIGIASEHHERIFEVFKRLHTDRHRPGAGVGLAICRRIIERHGGKLCVDSQLGEGATFWFTLPLARA